MFTSSDCYGEIFFQEGEIAPDNNIGRSIADALAAVPVISAPAFDKLFNDRLQVILYIQFPFHSFHHH